ncbi:hypothetical protein ABBQ38_000247 [Trebouxia sp. C0009 RCD-2024]
MLDMDFDSSLFDLPFEDLACLGLDSQQLQQPLAAIDFQDFCKDFATNDFAVDTTDNDSPAWGVEAATESSEQDTAVTTKSEDFLSSLDKSVFDPLEPLDSSFDNLFGSNVGSDAQVVPDMAPMEANAPEFAMPTYTQASPYIAPKTVAPGIGLQTRPYSWMNSMDYPLFGWPARTRLPSDPAARQQSLERYRDKKARRFNNSTKVRYEMRKVNADKRPRIKGRFVKPEELQSYLNSHQADVN